MYLFLFFVNSKIVIIILRNKIEENLKRIGEDSVWSIS